MDNNSDINTTTQMMGNDADNDNAATDIDAATKATG